MCGSLHPSQETGVDPEGGAVEPDRRSVLVPRLSAMRSPILPGGVGPVMARREEQISASVSTIVVVAGQTQVHMITLGTVRPAIVPPIV